MKLHDISLATRITVGAMAILVLGSATLLYVENIRLYDARVNELRSDLGRDIEAETLRVNQRINTMIQDTLFLSDIPPIPGIMRATQNHGFDARYHNSQAVWVERLQQIYSAFLKAHQNYASVRFIGVADSGREIVRVENRNGTVEVTASDRLQSFAEREFFKATLALKSGQAYLSDIDINQELGVINGAYQPTMRAATPVFDPSGKIFGMVVININLDHLLKPTVSNLPGIRTNIAISNNQYILQSPALVPKLDVPDKITDEFPFIKSMLDPRAPNYLPLQIAPTGTDDLFFAARRIQFDPSNLAHYLLLLYSIPRSELTEQVASTPTSIIFYEFVAMLVLGGIVLSVLRRTFSPLKQIADAADKIAAGGHDVSLLPVNSSGEIRSLARALNNLLSDLMQQTRRLKRVNEELNASQQRAERTSLLYKMLSEISSANIHTNVREHLFETTCQIIQESGLFHMVWIGLLAPKNGAIIPVAHAGYVEGYLDKLEINIHDNEKGMGPSAMAVKTGMPVTCGDIANDPRMRPWREEALRRGYLASATFPITQSGTAIGVLSLYFNQIGLLDEELVNALKGMMEDMSFSLDFIAESQRREEVQKELSDLTKHLQTALENERSHIARELHDELGQSMTALCFDLKWLHENISPEEARIHEKLQAINNLVGKTVDSIRRISEDLRPGMLDDLGLAAAIENHVAKFSEQSGIACDLSMNQADFDLDAQVATALFRIVQEALTNVARHSEASRVAIRVQELDDKMLLIVQDDGRGLPAARNPDPQRKSYGLLGMRERAKMLGGTLDVFNEKGMGVRIEACISKHVTVTP